MSASLFKRTTTLSSTAMLAVHQIVTYLQSQEKILLSSTNKYFRRTVLSFPLVVLEHSTSLLDSLIYFLSSEIQPPVLGVNLSLAEEKEPYFQTLIFILQRITYL